MAELAQRQTHSLMVTGSIPVSAKLFHKPLVWMFGDICNLSYWEDDGICASGLTCHKVPVPYTEVWRCAWKHLECAKPAE